MAIDKLAFHKAIESKLIKDKQKVDRQAKYKSKLINPMTRGYRDGILNPDKTYTMQVLRRISERAWIINVAIGHIIDKVIPYCRPKTDAGRRGFAIELKDPDAKMTKKLSVEAKEIQEFFLKTGWDNSLQHEDDINKYVKKILRDLLTLDQVASEKLWSRGGDLLSFEAIDSATILRCLEEGYDGDDSIRYVQMLNSQIVTQYQGKQILFDYDNPRTDVENYGYGYSKIEQCVKLVIASIQTFAFNAGAFTADKLPRGMLLLNGDIGFEEVEEIEDYLIDVMGPDGISGASNKWGIPIVPTGKGGKDASISWQALGSTNQEMQYAEWQDFLTTGVLAIYGVDVDSVGIKTKQSSKIIESGSAEGRKYSDDKGIGNALTFLERHFQHYLDLLDNRFKFVFYGFEQNDAKEARETKASELASNKSLNEIRRESDQEPVKFKFADVPGLQNPQYLQAYMAEIGQGDQEGQGDQGDQGDQLSQDDEFDDGFGKSLSTERVIINI